MKLQAYDNKKQKKYSITISPEIIKLLDWKKGDFLVPRINKNVLIIEKIDNRTDEDNC